MRRLRALDWETIVRRLAIAAAVGMFLVLVMGTTVTNTGSADGCGRSWPLCHGRFVPHYAFTTMIEFSHRFVTGIEGFLLLGASIGALKIRPGRWDTRILVALMLGSLVLQSGLGAMAVLWPQSPAILASHFGISLICFAATVALARMLSEPRDRSSSPAPLPARYRLLAWATVGAVLIVAYLGAYMRRSGNELACYTWPSCNGKIFPGANGSVAIALAHRVSAALAVGLVAALAWWSSRLRDVRPTLAPVAIAALGLIVAQALMGGAVVLSRLSLLSTLGHAALMALLFVALVDVARQSLPLRVRAPQPTTVRTASAAPAH